MARALGGTRYGHRRRRPLGRRWSRRLAPRAVSDLVVADAMSFLADAVSGSLRSRRRRRCARSTSVSWKRFCRSRCDAAAVMGCSPLRCSGSTSSASTNSAPICASATAASTSERHSPAAGSRDRPAGGRVDARGPWRSRAWARRGRPQCLNVPGARHRSASGHTACPLHRLVRGARLGAAAASAGSAGPCRGRPQRAADRADGRRQDAGRLSAEPRRPHGARPAEPAGLHTLYISPLKALSVDVARNLEIPVAEMDLPIRIETRTGDTPMGKRQRQRRDPPDILLTTPEQLALLLPAPTPGTCSPT